MSNPYVFIFIMDVLTEREGAPRLPGVDAVICAETKGDLEGNLKTWRGTSEEKRRKICTAKAEYGSLGVEDQGMLLHGDIIKSAEQVAYLGSTEDGRGETQR